MINKYEAVLASALVGGLEKKKTRFLPKQMKIMGLVERNVLEVACQRSREEGFDGKEP
jgi:hypothetical protein